MGLAAGLARLTADGLRVGKAAKNAARGVRRTAMRDVLRPARQLGALAGAYVQRTGPRDAASTSRLTPASPPSSRSNPQLRRDARFRA